MSEKYKPEIIGFGKEYFEDAAGELHEVTRSEESDIEVEALKQKKFMLRCIEKYRLGENDENVKRLLDEFFVLNEKLSNLGAATRHWTKPFIGIPTPEDRKLSDALDAVIDQCNALRDKLLPIIELEEQKEDLQ